MNFMKKLLLSLLCTFLITIGIQATSVQTTQKKICIIIPAYNEEKRIQSMLGAYLPYFEKLKKEFDTTLVIVANNCSDKTVPICKKIQKKHANVEILNFKEGGKGFAIKEGFLHALHKPYDYIGFVDADLATLPQYYHDLINEMKKSDGVIASRYAPGANVWPKRPFLRKIGGKFYNWILRKKLNIPFKDTQCGAKIFTYDTVKIVAPEMTEKKWAWDLEFLYLCKLNDKHIKEIPTTWSDQPGSHIEISTKLVKEFLACPSRIKKQHEHKIKTKKQKKTPFKK